MPYDCRDVLPDISSLPIRPNARFEWKQHSKERCRPYGRDFGLRILDIPFAPDPDSGYNAECAFRKRIAPVMPAVDPLKIAQLGLFVRKWLQKHLTPLRACEHEEAKMLELWLEQNKSYNLKRKEEVRRAYERITETGVTVLTKRDYECKSFLKREVYETYKYPRLINSRSDEFKARVAPYIHLIEKQVYSLKWFVKGLRIDTLPEKLVKLTKYPHILETDYSSFEAGFCSEYCDVVECELWRYMLKYNPNVLSDIMRCYFVSGTTPATQKLNGRNYTAFVTGTRMSGDMWTSLANGFSNLMNSLFIAKQLNLEVEGFVEGDDGIFGMYSDSFTERHFNELGFNIKMNYGQDLSHTCFCGNLFDPEECKLIISPEQIVRLDWSIDSKYLHASRKKRMQLLLAKAQSLYVMGKNTPIAGPLAFKIINHLRNVVTANYEDPNRWYSHELEDLWTKTILQSPSISQRSRVLYAENFHITVDEQLSIEKLIKESVGLPKLNFSFTTDSYVEGELFSS